MRGWLRHHGQSFAGTLARLARQPVATLLNVLAIGVTLALPLGTYVMLENGRHLSGRVSSDPQLAIFLAQDAGSSDVDRVRTVLKEAAGIRSIRFVPRDEALADLQRTEGMADVVAALRSNPLPDAFLVDIAPGDPVRTEALASRLKSLSKVAEVQLDSAWVKRLDALLRLGRTAVAVLASLLAVGLVAVTFNTIRLQILTQREEVEVCRLIGATDGYIQRPFYYQGTVLGALGGLVAILVVAASLAYLNRDVAPLAASYGSAFRLALPGWGDLGAAVGFAAILGWTGAYLSVSRHLRSAATR